MEDKEETMIRHKACCPLMAKWRCCYITEGTIFATCPDCSTVISVTDIHTHLDAQRQKYDMTREGRMKIKC